MSGIILCGVVLMQVEHASSLGIRETVYVSFLYLLQRLRILLEIGK